MTSFGRSGSRWTHGALALCLSLLAGAAPAKKGTASPSPEPQRAAASSQPSARPGEAKRASAADVAVVKPLTGPELQAKAAADLQRVRLALSEVIARMEDARHERDLVKLICSDEKLQRIKVLLTVAERADTALAEALAKADVGAEIESSKISMARAKVDIVRTEAAACIGQLAWQVGGGTQVVVEEPDERAVRPAGERTAPTLDPYRSDFGIPSSAAGR